MRKLSILAVVLLTGACSSEPDTGSLETRIAELETIIAMPTPTVSATATPESDLVVGIQWHCTLLVTGDGGSEQLVFETQELCERMPERVQTPVANGGSLLLTRYEKVLTIRTALGTSYTVAVDANEAIEVGDAWPP